MGVKGLCYEVLPPPQQQQQQPQRPQGGRALHALLGMLVGMLLAAGMLLPLCDSPQARQLLPASRNRRADVAQPLSARAAYEGGAASAGTPRVFVGVLSASGNVEAWRAVRETWGDDHRLARVMFFTLRPASNASLLALQREAARHGDLVVTSELDERYALLTHSTLALFRAAAAMGKAIMHIVKTDGDVFVRVPLLLAALDRMPWEGLFAGWPMQLTAVPRGGKNGVLRSNWAQDSVVSYGWGAGYVLTPDLAAYIGAGSPHLLMRPDNLLLLEDLAVGLWVEDLARRHNLSVHYDDSMRINTAYCTPEDVATHLVVQPKPGVMRCMHELSGECCGFPAHLVREPVRPRRAALPAAAAPAAPRAVNS